MNAIRPMLNLTRFKKYYKIHKKYVFIIHYMTETKRVDHVSEVHCKF